MSIACSGKVKANGDLSTLRQSSGEGTAPLYSSQLSTMVSLFESVSGADPELVITSVSENCVDLARKVVLVLGAFVRSTDAADPR